MNDESDQDKVNRVAKEIQDILVKNRCAMIPTISLQAVPEEKHIITPSDVGDILKP